MSVCRCLTADELDLVEVYEHLQWIVKDEHGLLMKCNQTGIYSLSNIVATEFHGGYYFEIPKKVTEEEAVNRFGQLVYGGYEPTLPKFIMDIPGADEALERIRERYRPKATVPRQKTQTGAPLSTADASPTSSLRATMQPMRRAFWYFATFLAGTMTCLQTARLTELPLLNSEAWLQQTVIGFSGALMFGLATRSFLRRARGSRNVSKPPLSEARPPGGKKLP